MGDDRPEPAMWDQRFSVGNALLDEQHKRLLALCERVAACLADDSAQSTKDFHTILAELFFYVENHFRDEEAMLSQRRYPKLAEQQAEHDDYTKGLAEFLYAESKNIIDKAALHQFLSAWWSRHILESDMQYRDFL